MILLLVSSRWFACGWFSNMDLIQREEEDEMGKMTGGMTGKRGREGAGNGDEWGGTVRTGRESQLRTGLCVCVQPSRSRAGCAETLSTGALALAAYKRSPRELVLIHQKKGSLNRLEPIL